MLYILCILIVIACVLLVLIILAQNPKGGGLSGVLGGTAQQFLGARQGTDFFEKATWYIGSGILVLVFVTYFLGSGNANAGAGQKSKVSDALDYDVSSMKKNEQPQSGPQTGAPAQPQAQPAQGQPAQPEKK